MRLSVLDQSPIAEGGSGGQALRNSLELAALADDLGYHRFWMAEHHATPALASASPELMLAALGRETSRIRIGTGGVMLPHYSPFKVAESFSMLAGLFPGRVDLGLGRAPGSDQLTAYALQQDRRQRVQMEFPQQVQELLGYYDRALPDQHPFRHLAQTLPCAEAQPDIWILGSSPDSAELAGALGLPYCIADFIAGEAPLLADRYRAAFRPSPRAPAPQLIVCCWLVAADSSADAQWLAGPSRMMFAHLQQGQLIAVPPPDVAADWLARNPVPTPANRRPIVGTPAECRSALEAKAALYGADELMLVNILHGHADRMNSYRLMAG
ncbi:LLM class flavin-dependent oxidoreductase [Sandaracinobacter neustonicus]|uniref:LLM class flavin-dependent oxidoreductase n=1 Tax=Sandaracinobacter neustonicus TaxID=1715348 RepID=A0A501XSU5_9SPHN|nr:LLM class flavin-dependent oxidoreductase [Sandaracinobacter neustonicus]TPE63738.1 LLM class flavin-dependent oxidoreductase [Sandaracinobacter neustonicus]